MKAKIILVVCIIGAVAIFAVDVYSLNTAHFLVSLALTLLIFVPLYFIYSVFALGKYKDSKQTPVKNQQATFSKTWDDKKDYGKVLKFPESDKKKK